MLFPAVAVAVVVVGPPVEPLLLLLLIGPIGPTWAAIGVTAAGQVTRIADRVRGAALGVSAGAAGAGGGLGSVRGGWLASVARYLVTVGVAGRWSWRASASSWPSGAPTHGRTVSSLRVSEPPGVRRPPGVR